MSKHGLRARPVFHHTRDAIEAHLTMVMAALAVARYLQDTTGMSIARIVRELHGLQEVVININAAPRLNPKAEQILTTLSTHPQHTKRHESGPHDCSYSTGTWNHPCQAVPLSILSAHSLRSGRRERCECLQLGSADGPGRAQCVEPVGGHQHEAPSSPV